MIGMTLIALMPSCGGWAPYGRGDCCGIGGRSGHIGR